MNSTEQEFLKFYMEQTWEEMRHLENLRERVSAIIITLATAITGFIIQQKFTSETRPLMWFIILLGIFGLLMTLKIFQIHQKSQKRLDKWYSYLETNSGDNPQILILRNLADVENKREFRIVSKIPHNYFWSTIFVFIIIAGTYLLFQKPTADVKETSPTSSTTIIIKNDKKLDTIYHKVDSLINKK
ncbi:MAG: hypothetical protein GXC73_18815 [Chitinophagaceae bacterium]|nr:hypothetical protein [Chitinophagaceae bacterium]